MSKPSTMLRTAQRPRESAHPAGTQPHRRAGWLLPVVAISFLLCTSLTGPRLGAQEFGKTPPPLPKAPPAAPAVDHAAARILRAASVGLQDKEPAVRAEAALTIGLAAVKEDAEALRALTVDEDPRVRTAAILALGFHASPGTEAVLSRCLADHDRDSPEHSAAIFSLSLLPEDRGGQALHVLMGRLRGGNWKRHHDTVLAFAAALVQQPQPMRVQRVRDMLAEVGRDEVLVAALLHALDSVDGALTDEELRPWLDSPFPLVRLRALDILIKRLPIPHAEKLERLATRDQQPEVRARALEAMTEARLPAALVIASRAFQSHDLRESMAGMQALLRLGGGRVRESVETDLLKTSSKEILIARLRLLPAAETGSLLDACAELAADERNPLALRGAATALVRRSGDSRADPVLPLLWEEGVAAHEVHAPLPEPDQLSPEWLLAPSGVAASRSGGHRALTARASAWLHTAPENAKLAVAELLGRKELPAETRAALLRAFRTTILQPARITDAGALPERLAIILR